jgi:hypothetical protein
VQERGFEDLAAIGQVGLALGAAAAEAQDIAVLVGRRHRVARPARDEARPDAGALPLREGDQQPIRQHAGIGCAPCLDIDLRDGADIGDIGGTDRQHRRLLSTLQPA